MTTTPSRRRRRTSSLHLSRDLHAQAQSALQRLKDGVISVDVRARAIHDLAAKHPMLRSWFLDWAKTKTTTNCQWDDFETARAILQEFGKHPPDPNPGRELLAALIAAGHLQNEIADFLNLPRAYISEFACGKSVMSPNTLAALRQFAAPHPDSPTPAS